MWSTTFRLANASTKGTVDEDDLGGGNDTNSFAMRSGMSSLRDRNEPQLRVTPSCGVALTPFHQRNDIRPRAAAREPLRWRCWAPCCPHIRAGRQGDRSKKDARMVGPVSALRPGRDAEGCFDYPADRARLAGHPSRMKEGPP